MSAKVAELQKLSAKQELDPIKFKKKTEATPHFAIYELSRKCSVFVSRVPEYSTQSTRCLSSKLTDMRSDRSACRNNRKWCCNGKPINCGSAIYNA